jgi:hypothetical protein
MSGIVANFIDCDERLVRIVSAVTVMARFNVNGWQHSGM